MASDREGNAFLVAQEPANITKKLRPVPGNKNTVTVFSREDNMIGNLGKGCHLYSLGHSTMRVVD